MTKTSIIPVIKQKPHISLPGDCQRELADILSMEKLCLSRLKKSLEQEQAALENRQTDALKEVVKEKQNALDEVVELQQRRANLLQQYGFSNDEQGVSSCIAGCSPSLSRELFPLWKQLHTLIEQCRDLNLVNGRILELNDRCVQQTLAILTNGTQPLELYSSQGVSSRQGRSTPLARA